jgi:hypothetical protein
VNKDGDKVGADYQVASFSSALQHLVPKQKNEEELYSDD